MDIVYDVKKTAETFDEKGLNLSWSSFDNFQTCQGLWFINYFLKSPPELALPAITRENSRAIPGTIIQKVMEVFVNDRVYRRPEMQSMSQLLQWMQTNTLAVYHLGIFPVDYQFKPDFIKTKYFWENKYGRTQREFVKSTYGLDDCFKEVNLSFVDKATFDSIYKSEEQFLNALNSLYRKILELWIANALHLNSVMSEIPLKLGIQDFTFSGSVDFIYNPQQRDVSDFTTLSQLENGYFIFDGKYNISSYTKPEQLQFYAFLVHLKTKKIPGRLALLNWKKGEFKDFVFDSNYRAKIESVASQVLLSRSRIQKHLRNRSEPQGLFFYEDFVPLNPGPDNCQFCGAVSFCPAAMEKGIGDDFSFQDKMLAKLNAQNTISGLDPDLGGNPDISL